MCRLFETSVCVLCLFVVEMLGFNLETQHYTSFETSSAENSMFGFSVAFHKNSGQKGRVLVGAPEATSNFIQVERPSGAVYACRIDQDNTCEEIKFDGNGNAVISNKQVDDKSGRWLGATLSTSSTMVDGRVVACAPRYIWFTKNLTRKDPVGSCFVSNKYLEAFEEYSPCRTGNWGYHRQGSCQAGFSAAINSEGDRLFIGAPGSYYWQGQMYSVDANAKFNYTPSWVGTASFGTKGSVFQSSLETRAAVYETKESSEKDDDSYMGYSTVVGDFRSSGVEGVVVGMPRGADLCGKVLFFTWDLTNYKNITSDQIGSYFGYAVAAADVDGDHRLDLIVGAPMHTEPNTKMRYDEGRVYVFYQNGNFERWSILNGTKSRARFGHALASLGDLNQDGFGDFAVGAPYDGPQERGAVYIFCGSKEGVIKKYTQVIYAEDIRTNFPILTFGFSIAGGLDLDGNEYPDMAVGSYLSNKAFFFRSKAVVKVNATLRFAGLSKEIDIKQKSCRLANGDSVACTDVEFCAGYHGTGIPQGIELQLVYNLDTKARNRPRMLFRENGLNTINDTVQLFIHRPMQCVRKNVYIQNEIRDKLTPLEAEVHYSIRGDSNKNFYYTRNPTSQLTPVLDLISEPTRKDSIVVQKNCGSDSVCIPDLALNVTTNIEKYLLGSRTNLEFEVVVNNYGEDSFETTFEIRYPEGVFYQKTESKDNTFGILCSDLANRTVLCDIGNPLPSRKIAKFKVIFQPSDLEGIGNSYQFDMWANSTNPENSFTLENNHKRLAVDIFINSSLQLTGQSLPIDILYDENLYDLDKKITHESDIGPQVTHVYTLRNTGPATIQEAEVLILWPFATLSGSDLLYLLDQPHTLGNIKCERAPANDKNVYLEFHTKNKTVWEALNIDISEHEMAQSSGLIVEEGPIVTGTIGGKVQSNKVNSYEKDIQETSGDGSHVHQQRHNASRTDSFSDTWNQQNLYGQQQFNTHWETSGTSGLTGASFQNESQEYFTPPKLPPDSGILTHAFLTEPGHTVITKSEWREVIENGIPVTKWTNITTVKDENGKIIKTFYNSEGDFTNIKGLEKKGQQSEYHSESGSSSHQQSGGSFHQSGGISFENRQQTDNANVEPGFTHVTQHETSYFDRQQQENRRRQEEIRRKQEEAENIRKQQLLEEERRKQQTIVEQQRHRQQQIDEERRRQQQIDEDRRRQQQIDDERRRQQQLDEERRRQQPDDRIRQQQIDEERRRQQQIDEDRRRQQQIDEERRRQQPVDHIRQQQLDEQRRRQQQLDEQRRQEEERRRIDEERSRGRPDDAYRRRLEEEEARRRQEHQRKLYEAELERRRVEDEQRRRQEEQQRYNEHGSSVNKDEEEYEEYEYEDENENQGQTVSTYNRTSTTTQYRDPIQGFPGQSHGSAADIASGQGFRVHTLDLGHLGSTSGVSGSSGSSSNRESSWQSSQSSGRRSWGQESHWSEAGQVPTGYHNTIERDNVPTDRPDPNARYRGKRQANLNPYNLPLHNLFTCNSTKCYYIKCVVGTLMQDKEVKVALRSRINYRIVRDAQQANQPINVVSMMVTKISKFKFVGTPKDEQLRVKEVETVVAPKIEEVPTEMVPLWIIILAAFAGVLILLLLILLLYKLGFFKRNRPSSAPERQPLNKNGYHHGDEAL